MMLNFGDQMRTGAQNAKPVLLLLRIYDGPLFWGGRKGDNFIKTL